MAGKIQIPVEANFNARDVDAELQKLVKEFNKVGQAVAKANQQKFNPLDAKATWATFDKMGAALEKLTSKSKKLKDELARTGQSHLMAHEIDFNRLTGYSSRARSALQHTVFSKAIQGTGAGFQYIPGQPHAIGAGGLLGGAARQIGGAALGAMGPAGRVAGGALGTAMGGGGLMAGLAGLGGGLAALAIGKAISVVREKVGAAENEMVGYDTLKRQLGDTGVAFNALKESVRGASNQIGVTFGEGGKLAAQYAKTSGISGKESPAEIMEALRTGGGLSRSFGLDPSQGVGFVGQMRLMGAASNDQQARRMALLIGEGIAKSGAFSKADEVLEAIAGYTTSQTRNGMAPANVDAYTSLLSGMMGSKIPGMDAASSAALLGRMNATFAAGGGGGEAGQNFMNAALSRGGALDPMDVAFLREQGMFGTFKGAFGTDKDPTMLRNWYQKNGLAIPQVGDQDATGFELVRRRLEGAYGGRADSRKLMANAMSNFYGINNTQAAAMMSVDPMALGGIGRRLGRLGIDLKDVNATGISRMAQIEGDGSMSEAEKDKAMRQAAREGQESTDGQNIRDSKAALENIEQEIAGKLIPATQAMRDGIMYLAGGNKGMSTRDIRVAMMKADSESNVNGIMDRYGDRQRGILEQIEAARGLPAGERTQKMAELEDELKKVREEQRAEIEKENAALKRNVQTLDDEDATRRKANEAREKVRNGAQEAFNAGAGRGSVNPDLASYLAETDRLIGAKPGTSAAQAMVESSMRPDAVSPAGARGLMQIMPKTQAELERRAGRKFDPNNPMDSAEMHRMLMQENTRAFGNVDDALRAYNGGWDRSKWGNAETSAYVGKIDRARTGYSYTPLPDTGTAGRPGDQKIVVEVAPGEFTLNDQRGQQLARTQVQASARVGKPIPAGMPGGN